MKLLIILSAILGFTVSPAWAQPAPSTAPTEVTLPTGAASPSTAPVESAAAPTRAVDARSNDFQDFGSLDLEALLNADVETASSRKEPISRAAAIIEILTRKQLYALGARDLYRALTFLPGIELLESFSGNTVLVFRGVLQDQFSVKVLLLLNGQPLYESFNKAFYLELIPLESIERIEVIRGPGSVLYGTNAFAGVVNVITRTRSEDGTESTVRLDGGHFTTGAFGAGNHGRSGDLTWSLFSAGNYTRGYPYRVQKNQNRDCLDHNPPRPADCTGPGPSVTYPYFNNYVNAFGSIGYKGLTVQLGGMRQHRQQYAIAAIARFHGANEIDYAYGNLAYTHEWRRFRITARAGLDRADRTSNIGHFPGPTFPETDLTGLSYLGRANITASWSIVPSFTLDQGIGFERGFVDPETVGLFAEDGAHHPFSPLFDGTPKQTSLSYFNHANWAITNEFSTVAGYRVTHLTTNYLELTTDSTGIPQQHLVEEDPLFNHSVRGGVVWAPTDSITFKLLYGSAFRAPSIAERVSIILQVVGTDPVIHPETTQTTEFGIDSRPLDWLSVRANGYVSVLRNLITRRPATPAEQPRFGARSVVYDNVPGSQRLIGSELSSTAILNASTSIFFNASLKQARLMPESRILRESALLTVNGGISWQARPWMILRPNAQYLGPRKRSHAYTLVNAVIDFPVTDALTLSALGENLGNASYTYPEFGTNSDIRNLPGGPERSFYGRAVLEF